MMGYKFRVMWPSTSLTVTINAKDYDAAERKVKAKHKSADIYQFLECVDPISEKDPYDMKLPKKVF